jgi:ADP-ribose pyrophosphatase
MPRKKPRSLVLVVSTKTVFRGAVFTVATDEVEEPGNIRVRRDVIRHSGSIVVLPLDDSGRTGASISICGRYAHVGTARRTR